MNARIRNWAPVVLAAVAAVCVIGALILAVNRSGEESRQNGQVLQILQDCLTPGGVCYQRSQTNQAHILQEVSDLQTYHALCIRNPGVPHTVPSVNNCVTQLVKEYGLG